MISWEGVRQLAMIISLAAVVFVASISIELAAQQDESVLLVGRALLFATAFVLATIGIVTSPEISIGSLVSPIRRFVTFTASTAVRTLAALLFLALVMIAMFVLGVGSVHQAVVGCATKDETKKVMVVQWHDWRGRSIPRVCDGSLEINVWRPFVTPSTFANDIRCKTRGFSPFPALRDEDTGDLVCDETGTAPRVALQLPPNRPTVTPRSAVPAPSGQVPPAVPAAPINENVYLSADLEVGKHSYQSVRYMSFVSAATRTAYSRGLVLASQDRSASVLTYRIPVGAKRFSAFITPYDTFCDRTDINGWSVSVITPTNTLKFDMFHYYTDQEITVPVDDIPAGVPRELTIVVDPQGDRTCDHPAFGNPHFEPTPR